MSQQPPRKPRRQLQGGRSSRAPRALGHAGRHWEALGRTGSLPPTLPQRGSSLVGSVPVPKPRFPSWHRGARGGVTVLGDIPTGAQETGGCAGCVGSAAQPDAGLAVIILIAADIFGSGAADVFAAPRLLQRAAAQPGQAPAVQPPGGAVMPLVGGRGRTGARGWAGFEAGFIRAEQKAPCAARPRSAADGAACHYARTGSREAPGCQKKAQEGDNPSPPLNLRGSPRGCPHRAGSRCGWLQHVGIPVPAGHVPPPACPWGETRARSRGRAPPGSVASCWGPLSART